MPRVILSLTEFPTPRQHVRHIFGQFIPHIWHMTCEVPLPFLVCLWWYNLVGNICWYNSCMAAAIIKGRVLLSIFSQFPLPFLFSQCVTKDFYCALARVVF